MKVKHTLAALLCFAASLNAFAAGEIQSASLEFATGNKTQMLRFGVQSDWDVRWLSGNGTHVGGYWEGTLAAWRGNQHQNVPGKRQNFTDFGFTPVFRWQADNKRGFYAEGGIGFHYLSDLYDNDGRRLSTHFQFGDHIGVGYVFDNNWEVAAKIQHFSNGGYKKPNSGVNFFVLKAAYRF
ncbi:acyloxyacyl hydrolase [Massilia sp. W12]|uniref:acyloxyacyl hydrolase n=1 Tax=Massilia sp. W12 TaxID=3126507 RepID=UPI0030D1E926